MLMKRWDHGLLDDCVDVILKSYDDVEDVADGGIMCLDDVLKGDAQSSKDMKKYCQ